MDYCILKFLFICLKAHPKYAFWWMCLIHRSRWKHCGLGPWKTMQLSTAWDDGGGMSEAQSLGWPAARQEYASARESLDRSENLLQMVKNRRWVQEMVYFIYYYFFKKQTFKLLDVATSEILLHDSINAYLSVHVHSTFLFHQRILFSTAWYMEKQNPQPRLNVWPSTSIHDATVIHPSASKYHLLMDFKKTKYISEAHANYYKQ